MSFTDQKPRIATEKEVPGNWGGYKDGRYFRCYLCGYKFKVGDYWRWIYSKKNINPIVCKTCDTEDVLEKWENANIELNQRFWWVMRRMEEL